MGYAHKITRQIIHIETRMKSCEFFETALVCGSRVKFVRFLFLFLAANARAAIATRCPRPSDPYDAPPGATGTAIHCRQSARVVGSPGTGGTSAQHAGNKTGSASR